MQVIGIVAPHDNIQKHLARFLSRPQLSRHESSSSRHELYGHELPRHQHSNADLSFARKRSLSKEEEEEEEEEEEKEEEEVPKSLNPHVPGKALRVRGGGGGGDRGEVGVGVEGGLGGWNSTIRPQPHAIGLVKCEGELGGGGGRGGGRGGGGRGERGGVVRGDVGDDVIPPPPVYLGEGGRRRRWSSKAVAKAVKAVAALAFQPFSDSESDGV